MFAIFFFSQEVCANVGDAITDFHDVLEMQKKTVEIKKKAEAIIADAHASDGEKLAAVRDLRVVVDSPLYDLERAVNHSIPDALDVFDQWFADRGHHWY